MDVVIKAERGTDNESKCNHTMKSHQYMPLFVQIPPKPDVLIIGVNLKDIPIQPGGDHL